MKSGLKEALPRAAAGDPGPGPAPDVDVEVGEASATAMIQGHLSPDPLPSSGLVKPTAALEGAIAAVRDWSDEILRALKETPAFFLSDLLPEGGATPEEAEALDRAARELAAAGKIAVLTSSGTVYRAGQCQPNPAEVVRLRSRRAR
jgi:hypothetical protein